MDYRERIENDIQQTLEEAGCQPILFVGTGLSIRYFGAPNWESLLQGLVNRCRLIDKPFAYYWQQKRDYIDIGQLFTELYQQWAWEADGRNYFPASLFEETQEADAYIKYEVAKQISDVTPSTLDAVKEEQLRGELDALRAIRPHSVITTNYDTFLEKVFPDFSAVIGQSILKRNYVTIGEIFKIHGCVSEPQSIVLNREDFEVFQAKKKYITAKLLTHLTEHPVLFAGYSASDPNIQSILADIDEILSPDGSLIPNIYFLERESPNSTEPPALEKLISVGPHRGVRVKSIRASDFSWVFSAFASKGAVPEVNPKLLRALLARTFELVRVDIPKQTVEVDYQILQSALNKPDGVLSVLGISRIDGSSTVNASFPYTLTEVGQALGYDTWHPANDLIQKIKDKKGVDLKSSDNQYHARIKIGKSKFRKYSDSAIHLLKKVRDKEDYEVNLKHSGD